MSERLIDRAREQYDTGHDRPGHTCGSCSRLYRVHYGLDSAVISLVYSWLAAVSLGFRMGYAGYGELRSGIDEQASQRGARGTVEEDRGGVRFHRNEERGCRMLGRAAARARIGRKAVVRSLRDDLRAEVRVVDRFMGERGAAGSRFWARTEAEAHRPPLVPSRNPARPRAMFRRASDLSMDPPLAVGSGLGRMPPATIYRSERGFTRTPDFRFKVLNLGESLDVGSRVTQSQEEWIPRSAPSLATSLAGCKGSGWLPSPFRASSEMFTGPHPPSRSGARDHDAMANGMAAARDGLSDEGDCLRGATSPWVADYGGRGSTDWDTPRTGLTHDAHLKRDALATARLQREVASTH